jgi:hypothetical protein
MERLKIYASRLLENAIALEDELYSVGLPVERRPKNAPPTQHLWRRMLFRHSEISNCAAYTQIFDFYPIIWGMDCVLEPPVRLSRDYVQI